MPKRSQLPYNQQIYCSTVQTVDVLKIIQVNKGRVNLLEDKQNGHYFFNLLGVLEY